MNVINDNKQHLGFALIVVSTYGVEEKETGGCKTLKINNTYDQVATSGEEVDDWSRDIISDDSNPFWKRQEMTPCVNFSQSPAYQKNLMLLTVA